MQVTLLLPCIGNVQRPQKEMFEPSTTVKQSIKTPFYYGLRQLLIVLIDSMNKELEQVFLSGVTPISPHGQNVQVASPVLHFLQHIDSRYVPTQTQPRRLSHAKRC